MNDMSRECVIHGGEQLWRMKFDGKAEMKERKV
jgi:hypothetical protein